MQTAVHSSRTPPLSAADAALSARVDRLIAAHVDDAALADAVRAGHASVLANYQSQRGSTNWVSLPDVGVFGPHYLDRASITEFIEFANDRSAAVEFQAFLDAGGAALTGAAPGGYEIRFPRGTLPEAKRFWSITAYTPGPIELVSNIANKYEVASTTPGLVTGSDGSVTIYLAAQRPAGVPSANVLPILPGLLA